MYITFEKALKRQHKDVILEGNIKVKMLILFRKINKNRGD